MYVLSVLLHMQVMYMHQKLSFEVCGTIGTCMHCLSGAGHTSVQCLTCQICSRLQSYQTLSHTVQDDAASSTARTQLAELQHNNGILKRAVAIQNNRIQDLLAKESESQQLKQALAQLQEKCHGLEMNNYSLAMHLKQATDSSSHSQQGQWHPDVY